jgi:hypothetical protein
VKLIKKKYIVIIYIEMPTKKAKLSVAQQKALMKTISASQLNHMKRHCLACRKMGGNGLGDIFRSIKNKFKSAVPFIGDIGQKVLKDVLLPKILPFAKNKLLPIAGNVLSKLISGSGLKLAGQRGGGFTLSGGSKSIKRKSPKLHLG